MPTFIFRNRNENVSFRCNLNCDRCIGRTKTGLQCRRRTCKSLPVCHDHLRIYYGLKIRRSAIPGAGFGLFTLRQFERNENICTYTGEILNNEELNQRYGIDGTAPFGLYVDRNRVLDSACYRGIGSWINHNRQPNARFVVSQRYPGIIINIRAIKNIPPNTEILLSYGYEYLLNQEGITHRTTPYT